MTGPTWMLLAALVAAATSVIVGRVVPPWPDSRREVVVSLVRLAGVVLICGLPLVALQAIPGALLACPTDAQCHAPYALPALVAAPLLFVGTWRATAVCVESRWPARRAMPVLTTLLVALAVVMVSGVWFRIDVPRP